MSSATARCFSRAVRGDDDAVEVLADLAVERDWVAGWALQVAVELRANASASTGELPSLSPDSQGRLERTLKGLIEGSG